MRELKMSYYDVYTGQKERRTSLVIITLCTGIAPVNLGYYVPAKTNMYFSCQRVY